MRFFSRVVGFRNDLDAYLSELHECEKVYFNYLVVKFSHAADNLLEGCIKLGLNVIRIGRPATVKDIHREYTLDALLSNHESVQVFRQKAEEMKDEAKSKYAMARRDLEDVELIASLF